ncbi:MAG: MarR family transcriptional regulator [Pseudarthrobacter sp.]|nr:MarR family transcriptional regulator [Pseudarthrobacter sp.]
MFTLTINQTDSRREGDQVPQLLKALRHIPARLDFDRSVEDEVQGIVDCPDQAVDAALIALRSGSWYVGIGAGPVDEPLPNQVKDASGHGLVYARRAVDRLRSSKERVPVAVEGPLADVARDAEAVLRLLGNIVRERSGAEWRVLDLLTPGVRGQQKAVAQELGITTQAVSKAVARAQWNEEHAARRAAARLLALILEAT